MDAVWDVDPGVLQPEQCPLQSAGRIHPLAEQESSGVADRRKAGGRSVKKDADRYRVAGAGRGEVSVAAGAGRGLVPGQTINLKIKEK